MSPLTPAELDRAEREINTNLARVDEVQGAPRRRVCLHPDRSYSRPDPDTVRLECDYCPAVSTGARRLPPDDLMPLLYLDG